MPAPLVSCSKTEELIARLLQQSGAGSSGQAPPTTSRKSAGTRPVRDGETGDLFAFTATALPPPCPAAALLPPLRNRPSCGSSRRRSRPRLRALAARPPQLPPPLLTRLRCYGPQPAPRCQAAHAGSGVARPTRGRRRRQSSLRGRTAVGGCGRVRRPRRPPVPQPQAAEAASCDDEADAEWEELQMPDGAASAAVAEEAAGAGGKSAGRVRRRGSGRD